MAGWERKQRLVNSFDSSSSTEEQNKLAAQCFSENVECFELIPFVTIVNSNNVSVCVFHLVVRGRLVMANIEVHGFTRDHHCTRRYEADLIYVLSYVMATYEHRSLVLSCMRMFQVQRKYY